MSGLKRMFPGGITGFLRDNNGLRRFLAADVVTNNIAWYIDITVDKCYLCGHYQWPVRYHVS